MSLLDVFALLIGSLTLSTAVMVVMSKNAIYAAMFLLATLLGVACEFALMDAHFLFIVQILVYAGAVVVLIVFVLMMLGFGKENQIHFELSPSILILTFAMGSILVAAGGTSLIKGKALRVRAFQQKTYTSVTQATLFNRLNEKPSASENFGSIGPIGNHLVSQNLLAFEVICVMLLMAIVGVLGILREDPQDLSLSLPPKEF